MSFSARILIQNCESAELDLNWDQVRNKSESEIKKCFIEKGLVVFVCFKENCTIELVEKVAKSILGVKIVNNNDGKPGKFL